VTVRSLTIVDGRTFEVRTDGDSTVSESVTLCPPPPCPWVHLSTAEARMLAFDLRRAADEVDK